MVRDTLRFTLLLAFTAACALQAESEASLHDASAPDAQVDAQTALAEALPGPHSVVPSPLAAGRTVPKQSREDARPANPTAIVEGALPANPTASVEGALPANPTAIVEGALRAEHFAAEYEQPSFGTGDSERETQPPLAPPARDVVRCGKRSVCVPPVPDALEACRAVLTLLRVEGKVMREASCEDGAVRHVARANEGALRGAALLDVSQPDTVDTQMIAFASERGYDRVVEFMDRAYDPVNGGPSITFTTFALEDVVRGGALELRMETRREDGFSLCDGSAGGTTDRHDFAFCGLDDAGEGYCLGFIPRSYLSRDYTYSYETDRRKYGRDERFTLDVHVAGRALVVKRTSGHLPKQFRKLLGTRSIAVAVESGFSGLD